MVLGYHVIISAYGFWLPNDPRGSWSDFVRRWELVRFGRAKKVWVRRSNAGDDHDRALRQRAKTALRYPPVAFTGHQARAVGRGFGDYANRSGILVWACSILPEHVHVVVGRHHFKVEHVVNQLKGAATRWISDEGLHPLARFQDGQERLPQMWSRRHWQVFLDTEAALRCAIEYVEQNPIKEGKPRQRWSFIAPFD